MAFPIGVNTDINLAKAYFSSLVEDYQNDLYIGGCTCDKGTMYVLDSLLTALLYKQEEDTFDDIAYNLYLKMMEIIGGEAYIPLYITFYRVGDDVFADSNKVYNGAFTIVNDELILTQGDEFETSIVWEKENNNLIVNT